MSDDLVQFLRDRLDEDAEGAHNIHDRQSDAYLDGDCICEYPARVLAEVEAKRWLLAQYVEHERMDRETFEAEGQHARSLVSLRAAYLDAVRALASVYTDHPDYREEWRP